MSKDRDRQRGTSRDPTGGEVLEDIQVACPRICGALGSK